MSEAVPVRAAVWRRPGDPASVEDVLLDPPRPGEVLVRVGAAGVCHSDLHLADGHLGDRFPIVLGHEGAGVVETVGDGVHHLLPGDRVAFSFVPACGTCRYCKAGRANLCEASADSSFRDRLLDGTLRLAGADGTRLRQFLAVGCFAKRCVVPAACAVPIPHALPLWQAALVGCAVVTGVGAVRNAARVRPGESVCVVGCGGVGLQVIAAARIAGADPIIAVDRAPEKLERARARGATHIVNADTQEVPSTVLQLAAGGVDHAFEVVGRPETIRLAWDCLRPGATAVVVGLAPRGVDASVPAIDFLSEKSLKGCFYGSGNPAAEIAELALLVAEDRFDVAGTISHATDLDGVEDAFGRLRRGEGARTVLVLDEDLVGPLPSSLA
ncbi:MAG: alcohol dehydrogenase catalytic domain-containing protein [Gaiellales bacterium]